MLAIQLLKCFGGFQWSLTLLRGANIQFSTSSSAKVSSLANICDLEMNLVSLKHKLVFSISFPVSHQNIGLATGYLDCFFVPKEVSNFFNLFTISMKLIF